MKVFLSWSGSVSKQVAVILREWLPNVIQAIDPWMSSEDIGIGARWSSEIAKELLSTKAGIICVTPDNHNAPWLNFEAGALSKTVEKEMVCPFLFDLKPSDLTGPLIQFQAAEPNRADVFRLLASINEVTPKPLTDSKLAEAFTVWWLKLEEKLSKIERGAPPKEQKRSSDEMVEEILSISREQARDTQRIVYVLEQTRAAANAYRTYDPIDRLLYLQGLQANAVPSIGDHLAPVSLRDYDPPMEDAGVDGGEVSASNEEGPIRPE